MTDDYALEESQAYYELMDELNNKWVGTYTPRQPRDYSGYNLWDAPIHLSDDEFAELQELRKQCPPVPECDTLYDFWTGEEIP